MQSIAVFGGTFDPVHNGHIQTCISIQAAFHFDVFYFIPCKVPTLKSPATATNQQRIDMLQLAINHLQNTRIDLREIERDTPSYMVETLTSLRAEHKSAAITLIIGYDAFLSLPQWHQWSKLIDLANLVVIDRPLPSHVPLPAPLQAILQKHQVNKPQQCLQQKAGAIYLYNAGHYDISSTEIRACLQRKQDVGRLVPKEVIDYIKNSKLYQ